MKASDFKPGFIPKGPRLVIYPLPTERVTESGIILHDVAADREDMKQIEALVLLVGVGCFVDARKIVEGKLVVDDPWCVPGDRILIAAYAGLYRKGKDGKAYRIIDGKDVVAVLED